MTKTCDLTSGSIPRHLLRLAAAVTINVALDYCFVAKLRWGIAGATWATAASQAFSAAVCMLYLKCRALELLFRREDRRMDRALLRQTAQFSFVTALHQSSLYIGQLLVQGAVNTGGTEMVSAYTATTRIEGFANSFGDTAAAPRPLCSWRFSMCSASPATPLPGTSTAQAGCPSRLSGL